ITVGGLAYARGRRSRLYRSLAERISSIKDARRLALEAIGRDAVPSFADRLARLTAFLPLESFEAVKGEAERLVAPERSFVPTHKKGGTTAYETLIANAPSIVALYHSPELIGFVSRLVGARVRPTPVHDQSSLSVLFYDKPGDHIGW